MESRYTVPNLAMIDTADRIARAAYLWLRQRAHLQDSPSTCSGSLNGEPRARLFVAGFIFELCDTLHLTQQHGLLAAYAYSLLDGGDPNALGIATILADARTVVPTSMVFDEGRLMANEMFGLLESSGLKSASAQGDDPAGVDNIPIQLMQ